MTVSIVLVGSGALVAGAVGLWLPPGERLAAGLALVIGAGAGIVALAVGLGAVGTRGADRNYERVFLIASAVGFAAVVASSMVLRNRSGS